MYPTFFSYLSYRCGSCRHWTLRHLDLNPENLESCEGSRNEKRVFGLQRSVGIEAREFRDCVLNHKLERDSLPASERERSERFVGPRAVAALLPGRGSKNAEENGSVGPLIRRPEGGSQEIPTVKQIGAVEQGLRLPMTYID